MAPTPPKPRPSYLVLVVVLTALGVGGATSIIVAARAPAPFVPSTSPELFVSEGVILLFLALLFGGIIVALVRERLHGAAAIPGRVLLGPLLVVLCLIAFVVMYRYIQTSVSNGKGTGNGTSPPTPPPPAPPPPGPPLGGGGGTFGFLHLPTWTLFAFLVVAAVVVVAVVVPRARSFLRERDDRRTEPSEGPEVRRALGRAAHRLAAGHDARAVILDLYAKLLARVEPLSGDLGPATPEEIRIQHLLRLGIDPATAVELTRLFEEARYSTHPLGPEAAGRAGRAIVAAEADLARVPIAP